MLKWFTLVAYIFIAAPIAFAQAPYFQGKTIKIIRGGESGGTGDMQARAVIPFLKKHIPGNPTLPFLSPSVIIDFQITSLLPNSRCDS